MGLIDAARVKAVLVVLAALLAALATALVWGLYTRYELGVLRGENSRLQADLEAAQRVSAAYEEQAKRAARTGAVQSDQRSTARAAVSAAQTAAHAEEGHDEVRPLASAAQLDRLRRIANAGSAGIHSASKLP